ncbi:hypothetical protein E4U13_003048, partial [Claviceps humidiphila]
MGFGKEGYLGATGQAAGISSAKCEEIPCPASGDDFCGSESPPSSFGTSTDSAHQSDIWCRPPG